MSEDREIEVLRRQVEQLGNSFERQTEHIWQKVNANARDGQALAIAVKGLTKMIEHQTVTLNRIDAHLSPSGGKSHETRITLLEDTEAKRTWSIRLLWTAIVAFMFDWIQRHI